MRKSFLMACSLALPMQVFSAETALQPYPITLKTTPTGIRSIGL